MFSPEKFRSVYPILVATPRSPISPPPPPALVATSNAWYKMILCTVYVCGSWGGGGQLG